MNEIVIALNFWLSVAGIFFIVGALVLLFDIFFNQRAYFGDIIRRYGIELAMVLTMGASIMTLLYSEVFGFVPCGLCWLQRVFLYPQALILPVAYIIKDRMVVLYGIVLSALGLVVALYHHYIQMGGSEVIGCPTSGGDCGQRILFEFGFMTYPLMSAGLFLFLVALYAYLLPKKA